MTAISLEYGTAGVWEGEIARERLLAFHPGPSPLQDVRTAVADSLTAPIDFPMLRQAFVPDDQVVFALDRDVPSAAEIVAELWNVCAAGGIAPDRVLILQPASLTGSRPADPRRLLSDSLREVVRWKIHDPTADQSTGYLASTAGGERIYLAREILDADFVIPISRLGYDTLQGRRHAMSAFYPGYSTTEAFTKSRGQGHSELGPDDERPLRQLVHELTWLLGIQFVVQTLPAGSRGGAAGILAGQPDAVVRKGIATLDDDWRVRLEQRGETVVVSIPSDGESTTWDDLGTALDAARKLVMREGRIIVLSDLAIEPSPGIEMLRSSRSAKAALKPLRTESPADVIAASQIATAADWATVYLHSRQSPQLVEELFMTPLEHEREISRLLSECDGCVVLAGGQHTYSEIAD